MEFRCPGSSRIRQPIPEIFTCSDCGAEVEIWTSELRRKCSSCGKTVARDIDSAHCIQWCRYAKECIGVEEYEELLKKGIISEDGEVEVRIPEKLKSFMEERGISVSEGSYRIFIKDLRFSRLLRFARNDRLRVLFVIASEAKQSLSKPQLFSEVSIDRKPYYFAENEMEAMELRTPDRNKCILRKELAGIVGDVFDSYQKIPATRNIGESPLPCKSIIVEILEGIRDILFPGYYGISGLCWENVRYYIGSKIDELFVKLSDEICKSLRHECQEENDAQEQRVDRSEKYAAAFFKKLPKLRELLAEDVGAAYEGDPAAKNPDEIIFSYPGMLAISTYRIAHELHIAGVPLIPRIMTEYAHGATGIDIHPGAAIGRAFFIDHGTGVVIGETSDIGDRVRIYQGVTLGALSVPKDGAGPSMRGKKRHPTIEDDVTIYAGATILGGDTVIGKGSTIGGNVWLVESVPPETRVVIEKPGQQFKTNSANRKNQDGQEAKG